ncbi:fimbrial protein [Pseudomonas protegens]|uniref:fimbrial protein n=1 Tax=Pseudomonas protegens TaxID=380021 RepID=UPI0037F1A66C
MNNRGRSEPVVLALSLLLAALPRLGLGQENMEFSGRLIAPTCTVSNQGQRLDVEFKEQIAVSKINGENYRQQVPYRIDCEELGGADLAWSMKLTFKGTGAEFNLKVLKTSVPGLGIKLRLGDEDFDIDQTRQISLTGLPTLEAVPVKEEGAKLPNGPFTASASLIAELY